MVWLWLLLRGSLLCCFQHSHPQPPPPSPPTHPSHTQFPAEEEWLWPCYTALVPKPPKGRGRTPGILKAAPGKTVVELTPRFLWDARLGCVGRWRDIEASEAEMAQAALAAASRGLGLQFLIMAVPMLFVDRQVDVDYGSVDDAILQAFSVFDPEDTGRTTRAAALELIEFFYTKVLGTQGTGVPGGAANHWAPIVLPQLEALCEPPGEDITWHRFRDFFAMQAFTKF